jgi:hypothetical protein
MNTKTKYGKQRRHLTYCTLAYHQHEGVYCSIQFIHGGGPDVSYVLKTEAITRKQVYGNPDCSTSSEYLKFCVKN